MVLLEDGPVVCQEPSDQLPVLLPMDAADLEAPPSKLASAKVDKPSLSRSRSDRSERGKPGSKRYARWLHQQLMVGNLRSIMYESGEEVTDVEDLSDSAEYRPSPFMRLAESPELFQDFMKGREKIRSAARGQRSRAIPLAASDCDERDVLRKFKGMRKVIGEDGYVLHFVRGLETQLNQFVDNVFKAQNGSCAFELIENEFEVLSMDKLDQEATKLRESFDDSIVLVGVDALLRKVCHQMAFFYGLQSSSFKLKSAAGSEKVVIVRTVPTVTAHLPSFSISDCLMSWSE